MRVYFLAEKTSALRLNGVHVGIVDLFERSIELSVSDGVCVEIAPHGAYLPVRFALDEAFLLSPPEQVRLYFSQDYVAIYVCGFLRADQSMRTLWQTKINGATLTLFLQGKLQLSVQTERGFHLVTLPDELEKSIAEACGEYLLLRAENAFALLSREGELLVCNEGTVLHSGDILKAEVPFHDCMGRTAICEWKGEVLQSCTIRSRQDATPSTFALALFESAIIGADCTPFLHPSIREKAGSLLDFLGKYHSVVLTEQQDTVGLVYLRKERIFDVRYFTVALTDGLISNVTPVNAPSRK